MKRVDIGANGCQCEVWAVSKRRLDPYRKAVKQFGRVWFHGLGGTWLAGRLIQDAEWQGKPLAAVVKEIAEALEHGAADDNEWRQTKDAYGLSRSTAYYQGDQAFHPTAVWTSEKLAADLKGNQWRVEPSSYNSPRLIKNRRFIEVFPWTEDEDVRRAFAQTRKFLGRPLPAEPRSRRDISESLEIYETCRGGASLKILSEKFGFSEPSAVHRHITVTCKALGLPRAGPRARSQNRR
jgi:hypothetical protein